MTTPKRRAARTATADDTPPALRRVEQRREDKPAPYDGPTDAVESDPVTDASVKDRSPHQAEPEPPRVED